MKLQAILELIIIIILCTIFVFNVWEHFEKFIAGETTNFVKTTREDGLDLPALVLCPTKGYKFGRMRELNISEDHWLINNDWDQSVDDSWQDSSVQDMEKLYQDTTYKAEELIREVLHYNGSSGKSVVLFDGVNVTDSSRLTMHSHRSLSHGICVSVRLLHSFDHRSDGLRVRTRSAAGDVNMVLMQAMPPTPI